jgi:iron complex outermembrane receptor protein
MRKYLLLLFISLLTTGAVLAQDGSVIKGKLLDAQTKETLIGASVLVKGTTNATTAALDGSFKITAPTGSTLVFSYIGYVSKEVTVTGKNLGDIFLDPASSSVKEVTITGDVAIDRRTPIAVTTINAKTIEEKIGTQDLPALLAVVPGVMTSNTSGYGDSRVSIRGFSSTSKNGNVAMTINGIPVNDMENGNTYWSDFTGLSDVTTSFQVQRGLGAAKIIVPSFGGTINITTRNTDAVKGGYVFSGIGSDGYSKFGALISTGLTPSGWAATFQGSKTEGNYHADNTEFLNYNYFFNLSKVLSATQTISFSLMGASQKHNTRFSTPIYVIEHAPQGIRYNPDAGVLNGQPYDPYQNFFSKPLASLNHSWVINDKSSLSTVLYATYGTGGGVSLATNNASTPHINGNTNGLYDYSPFDLTAIAKTNATTVDGAATNYIKTSENDHHWYGIRSTFNTQLTNDINLSAGIDLKDYQGTHFTKVNNLLGAGYVLDVANKNAPNNHAFTGDKISFYNVDDILSGGAFLQSEYVKNDLSAFITLSGTESRDQRNDYFTYLDSDPNQHSPWVSFFTYQAKGGANYNINEHMNVFANIGYITKPPYFDNVFINFKNDINKKTVPEKLFSYELGYGYKTSNFSANLNFYRSSYMNRAFTKPTDPDPITGVLYSINISGVNELHQGGELELKFKPVKEVTINGSLSVGDWHYSSNSGPVQVFDDQNQPVKNGAYPSVLIKGIKVGDAPQTQAHIGADVDVLPDFRLGADYFYNGNYTSNFFFNTITTDGLTPWKIPTYNLLNVNAVLRFKIAGLDGSLVGNVINLLNTKYISDANDGSVSAAPKGVPQNTNVYFGYGRTFGTSLKIKF